MVTKKIIGQVTVEEKNEIQTLFERRNGLNELAKIVTADNTELYEKLVKDLGETGTKFQNHLRPRAAPTKGLAPSATSAPCSNSTTTACSSAAACSSMQATTTRRAP